MGGKESLRLVTQRQNNALVMCISLVAGWCTFPVYGAGAVGTGSVFAYCGLAGVSLVLLDIRVSKPGVLLGGAS